MCSVRSTLTPSSLSFCSYKYVSSSYTDPPDQLADTNQEEDVPGERDLINFDKYFFGNLNCVFLICGSQPSD